MARHFKRDPDMPERIAEFHSSMDVDEIDTPDGDHVLLSYSGEAEITHTDGTVITVPLPLQ